MTSDLVKHLTEFQHMMPEGGASDPLIETFQSLAGQALAELAERDRVIAEKDEEIGRLTGQVTPGSPTERYPTVWAYEQACKALHTKTNELAVLKSGGTQELTKDDR